MYVCSAREADVCQTLYKYLNSPRHFFIPTILRKLCNSKLRARCTPARTHSVGDCAILFLRGVCRIRENHPRFSFYALYTCQGINQRCMYHTPITLVTPHCIKLAQELKLWFFLLLYLYIYLLLSVTFNVIELSMHAFSVLKYWWHKFIPAGGSKRGRSSTITPPYLCRAV
jgi:hypothetical protein